MSLQNIKKMKAERGFTIVELLIVIVVIGILAAIVIVAYNGVTNRAKGTKAQATGSSIQKKLEAYNAEVGNYPATYSLLTGAATTATYYIPSGSYTLKTTAVANGDSETTFNFGSCATTGYRVTIWDYTSGAAKNYDVGGCAGAVTLITS